MITNFEYIWEPPKKYTFQMPGVCSFVERYSNGEVLNLFAGKTLLNLKEIRVDINPEMPADHHQDAAEFVRSCGNMFDTVILDPPYNIRKSREKYNVGVDTFYKGKLTIIKNLLLKILNPGARVISLGYDSVGMSASRGFKKIAICLVCHGGDHNDTICLVEEMTENQGKLF